ncbi:TonB-dependent siderophore receptor [Steroidobacter flavus]|uniref:TonB-dependent siderophore receptor n=1 Tax=Steroidobacter flavus TaxID=1842136 RepID=A0ABV8SQI0_9GAMM
MACVGSVRAGVALVLAFAAVTSASAQESEDAQKLKKLRVEASEIGDTTEGTGSYGASSATIGKGSQRLKDVTNSVTVITRERLEDQNLQTLDEALQAATGIVVEQNSSYERAFYSRGFQISSVQFDGVPTQFSQTAKGFAIQGDTAIYDRVEVLRGPAGLFAGASTPGGTVNLVRKRASADFAVRGSLSVGSWNNYRSELDVTGGLNGSGSLRGRFVAAYQDREFFYDVAETKKPLGYGIIEYDLGSSTTIAAGMKYEENQMTPFYAGLPRYADGRSLNLSRSTYLNAAWSDTNAKSTTVFADLKHRFNDVWELKIGALNDREDNHDHSGSAFGTVNVTTLTGSTLSAFNQHLIGNQNSADATLTGGFDAFGRRHDVIVGANYWKRTYDLDSQLFTVPNPAINPLAFDPSQYAVFPTVPARAKTRTEETTEQTGFFGSVRFRLTDPLSVIVGGRFSEYENEVFNKVTGLTSAHAKDSDVFTPYGAVSYELGKNWSTYVSYAETFTSQASSYTAAGEPLDPAEGQSYEIGLKGELFEGLANVSFAAYQIEEVNRRQTDPNTPNPCPASPVGGVCSIAEGEVRSRGFDAEINGTLTESWNVFAGYTYTTTEYLRDKTATGTPSANEGKPLSSFTPKHSVRVWTDYKLPGVLSRLSVGGGVNAQTEAYKTSGAIRFQQGGYAIWSTRASYQLNDTIDLALNVNNLTDKTYLRTIGGLSNGNWYGEPRNFMFTVKASFE